MQTPLRPSEQPVRVAALYRFARLDNYRDLREPLERLCREHRIGGTLLLAHEGINGTIAGTPEGIDAVLAAIRALPDCAEVDVKLSTASTMPFHRMKVRLKREIVTMGQPGIDPRSVVGTYVEPGEWNALISDPDTIVIDTRNDYEVVVGTFSRAINPETVSFREFPEWFRRERERLLGSGKPPKVAMFCTGGIRCEKAAIFMEEAGVKNVYQLEGGILKYFELTGGPHYDGNCFVFDERETLDPQLAPQPVDSYVAG